LALKDTFKPLLKAIEIAFKKLHLNGSYKPEDLDTVPEFKNIVFETNGVLSRVFKDNNLSKGMLERLKNDVFLFSALKSHAQLFEASRLLLTEDKKIKSFETFSNDVKSIKSNYNENYLEAEYEFAVGSTQMAERWDGFTNSKRYNLQYRTAGDSHVRETHAVLNGITLPQSDPFWNSYYAPNGWRCRCTVVEVLASTNEASDSEKSVALGEKATSQIDKDGNNKLEIFRFNPAKEKVIFPPKHPYHKVQGAATIKKQVNGK
jgi:SPP1 gp7 family putative phage head morphogenesis protein